MLVALLIGVLPTWPYAAGWGVYPNRGLGVLMLIVIVLLIAGGL